MKYYKIEVRLSPKDQTAMDILEAQMGERGFESFVETDNGVEGYIQQEKYAGEETMAGLDPMIKGVRMKWEKSEAPDEDWNTEWEKNYFSPIKIEGGCTIRSTFHEKDEEARYEILINPQMAFGTGHHETTRLMVKWLLSHEIEGRSILDMGCGTGVLGILAHKRGAQKVVGIDIDEWSVSNARDNIGLNDIAAEDFDIRLGGAEQAEGLKGEMDIVLANINRNILMHDMGTYVGALKEGGRLIMSGFYDIDCQNIKDEAAKHGLEEIAREEMNKWTRMEFEKK